MSAEIKALKSTISTNTKNRATKAVKLTNTKRDLAKYKRELKLLKNKFAEFKKIRK